MPCEECRQEWEDPTPNQNLIEWSMALHNKVNKILGKYDKYDIIDFNICQKRNCDICANEEQKNMFPWQLIHYIADKYGEESLAFLKEFNTLYPCDSCRINLLIDDPQEGESILDWTIRNHNRINAKSNLPEYHYMKKDLQSCEGCQTSKTTVVGNTNITHTV